MHDYLGNRIEVGDKIICIVGRHFKKAIIKEIVMDWHHEGQLPGGRFKVEGIKRIISSYEAIKMEW